MELNWPRPAAYMAALPVENTALALLNSKILNPASFVGLNRFPNSNCMKGIPQKTF